MAGNLKNRCIALTRSASENAVWARRVAALGARPLNYPCIEIVPVEEGDYAEALRALEKGEYRWAAFTSAKAARLFAAAYRHAARAWPTVLKIAAVGEKTAAALGAAGLPIHLQPGQENARALAELFPAAGKAGEAVLFPRGDLAKNTLVRELQQKGYRVDDPIVYGTRRPPNLVPLAEVPDAVFFASPSAARHFFQVNPPDAFPTSRMVSIGPSTSQELKDLGLGLGGHVQAESPDLEAMLRALAATL